MTQWWSQSVAGLRYSNVSFSKTLFPLLCTGSTQETFQHDLKIVHLRFYSIELIEEFQIRYFKLKCLLTDD